MASFFRRREHKYAPLAGGQHVDARSENIWTRKHIGLLVMLGALAAVAGVFAIGYPCIFLKNLRAATDSG